MCRMIARYLKRNLKQLKKSGAICSFVVTFVVTFLGVWTAFWLTGLGDQWALDRMTRQRLHLAVLEARYVGGFALDMVQKYGQDEEITISVVLLDSSAAQQVLGDPNALLLLPLHKVSMLKWYVAAVEAFNQSLTVHLGVLESTGHQRTAAEEVARELVRENAANVVAVAIVMKDELNDFFDEQLYDQDVLEEYEGRAQELKDAALEGRVKKPDSEQ